MGCYFRVGNSGISQHLILGCWLFYLPVTSTVHTLQHSPPYAIKKMKHRKPQRHPFSHKK